MITCTFCDGLTPATWIGYYEHVSRYGQQHAYKAACDAHKAQLAGLDDIQPVEQVVGMGVMTFGRACELFGYDRPQEWMEEWEQQALIETAVIYSYNDASPIPPELVESTRYVIESF